MMKELNHNKELAYKLIYKKRWSWIEFLFGKKIRKNRILTLPDIKWMHFVQRLEKEVVRENLSEIPSEISDGIIVSKKELFELNSFTIELWGQGENKSISALDIGLIGPVPRPPCPPDGYWSDITSILSSAKENIIKVESKVRNGAKMDHSFGSKLYGNYNEITFNTPIGSNKKGIEIHTLFVHTNFTKPDSPYTITTRLF